MRRVYVWQQRAVRMLAEVRRETPPDSAFKSTTQVHSAVEWRRQRRWEYGCEAGRDGDGEEEGNGKAECYRLTRVNTLTPHGARTSCLRGERGELGSRSTGAR